MKLNVAEQSADDEDTPVIYDNDTQTNYNPGTGGYGFDDIAYGTPTQVQTPAVTNNTVSAAPAVTGSSSISPAPAEKSDSSASQQEEEQQPESDGPTIIGTTKKAENKLAAPAATAPAADTGSATAPPDYRRLAMIICSAGAILSVIGLIICALVGFNRSREKYY